jgi:LysM repeat protein
MTTQSYTVASGDSLWAIAEKVYGDGSRWTDIYEANQDIIGDNPNIIQPNQNLVIPTDFDNSNNGSNDFSNMNWDQDSQSYTVASGDSLWAIAEKIYGDGSRWPEIYEANQDVIGDNPNLIYPDQDLVIPLDNEDPYISSNILGDDSSEFYPSSTDQSSSFSFENVDLEGFIQGIGELAEYAGPAKEIYEGAKAIYDLSNPYDGGNPIEEAARVAFEVPEAIEAAQELGIDFSEIVETF